tara:strand:+ start:40828 stop:41721 length:894 start_codon:yes stop_codon:yes gene_type:complete
MKISAVIPTKNRGYDLVKAVESIYNQLRKPDELIIVDQSDNDSSKTLVNKLNLPESISLIYIHDRSIKGLVDAKYHSLKYAKFDIISFLEDDIVLEEDYFREIYNTFKLNSKILGCSGVITNANTSNLLYIILHYITHIGIFRDDRPFVYRNLFNKKNKIVSSNVISGGLSSWRLDVFKKISFDTLNNFHLIEDFEFSFRFNKFFSNSLFIISNAKLAHYFSPINRENEIMVTERKIMEFLIFYKKNINHKYSLLSIFVLLLSNILLNIYRSIVKLDMRYIKSFFIGFKKGLNHKIK